MNRQREYKTKQREQVLECLVCNRNRHMTADEIVVYLSDKGEKVGKTTVYRTLEKLIDEGSARKFISEEGKSACYQFVSVGDCCPEHFHLKCRVCGSLLHIECDYLCELEQHIFDHHGFRVDNTKTVLYGVCEECRKNEK